MSSLIFLTLEEVVARYRGQISEGTFCSWRSRRIGPSFIKVGKAVLYPLEELERWDGKNLVVCRSTQALQVEEPPKGSLRNRLHSWTGTLSSEPLTRLGPLFCWVATATIRFLSEAIRGYDHRIKPLPFIEKRTSLCSCKSGFDSCGACLKWPTALRSAPRPTH